jgi:hypothetical protein
MKMLLKMKKNNRKKEMKKRKIRLNAGGSS